MYCKTTNTKCLHIFFYRFLLHLSCQSPVLEGPANFSVVETNAFKHLNHLSLRLIQGSDKEIKDYLAVCLSALKVCSFSIIHYNTVWIIEDFYKGKHWVCLDEANNPRAFTTLVFVEVVLSTLLVYFFCISDRLVKAVQWIDTLLYWESVF